MFSIELLPLELATVLISEKPEEKNIPVYTEAKDIGLNSEFLLKHGKISMTVHLDKDTNQTTSITFDSTDKSFKKVRINESLIYFDGATTHSCVYLFNPKDEC